MFSRYVVWKPSYNVGHPVVDEQHQEIIDVINELFAAIQQNQDRAAMRPVLDRLVDYTERHFEYEEQILEESDYPNLARHRAVHDQMRRKTMQLRDSLSLETGRNSLAFLKNWWVGHIQGQDKRYSPYLEAPAHA